MKPPLIGQGFGARGISARNAENVWFEPRPQGEKAMHVVRALPRLEEAWQPKDLRLLASLDSGQYALAVDGVELHRVVIINNPLNVLTATPVATLPWTATNTNFVEPRAAGGHDGWIVTTGHPQYVSYSNMAIMHTLPTGLEAISCVYHRGYYVIASQQRLYWMTDTESAPNPLNYAGADVSQDDIVEVVDLGSAIAVFGQRTIQFFAVVGNADNPFQPILEATQRIGVAYNRQIKVLDGIVYFWGYPEGGTPGLFALKGLSYTRIGNEDLERAMIEAQLNAGSVTLDGFMLHGHPMVKLHGYGTGRTIMFDASLGVPVSITEGSPWHGRTWSMGVRGNVITGSQKSVGIMRQGEVDSTVRRSVTTDHIVTELLDRFQLDNVRADCVGMPAVQLEYSKDGGYNWIAHGTQFGANSTTTRTQWNRLGTGRQFTLRLSATGDFNVANLMLNARN